MLQGRFGVAEQDQGGSGVIVAFGAGEGENPPDLDAEILGVFRGVGGVGLELVQGGARGGGVAATGCGAGLDGGDAREGLRPVSQAFDTIGQF